MAGEDSPLLSLFLQRLPLVQVLLNHHQHEFLGQLHVFLSISSGDAVAATGLGHGAVEGRQRNQRVMELTVDNSATRL